ncbi:hypothetical protein CC86DRAFT_111997 [Ophiobolus disseminans]|uniref:Uncharacterized protein n=1 Tax=Ophiobolus disseminans TaxID=1469910 RepID=A0A6A6ZKC1_9PLEO|nr:hypothetical protein CC86DRAFT_111997 [Ophiobolus disseminans]
MSAPGWNPSRPFPTAPEQRKCRRDSDSESDYPQYTRRESSKRRGGDDTGSAHVARGSVTSGSEYPPIPVPADSSHCDEKVRYLDIVIPPLDVRELQSQSKTDFRFCYSPLHCNMPLLVTRSTAASRSSRPIVWRWKYIGCLVFIETEVSRTVFASTHGVCEEPCSANHGQRKEVESSVQLTSTLLAMRCLPRLCPTSSCW